MSTWQIPSSQPFQFHQFQQQFPSFPASTSDSNDSTSGNSTSAISPSSTSPAALSASNSTITPTEVPQPQPLNPDLAESFECSICMELSFDPVITHCNHLFCKLCLLQCIDSQRKCPNCRVDCDDGQYKPLEPNTLLHSIWSSIQVQCQNHDRTCLWTGSIRDYPAHKANCSRGSLGQIGSLRQQIKASKQKVQTTKDNLAEEKNTLREKEHEWHSLTQDLEKVQKDVHSQKRLVQALQSEFPHLPVGGVVNGNAFGTLPFGVGDVKPFSIGCGGANAFSNGNHAGNTNSTFSNGGGVSSSAFSFPSVAGGGSPFSSSSGLSPFSNGTTHSATTSFLPSVNGGGTAFPNGAAGGNPFSTGTDRMFHNVSGDGAFSGSAFSDYRDHPANQSIDSTASG